MAIKFYHIILAVHILGCFLLKWAAFGELLGWKSPDLVTLVVRLLLSRSCWCAQAGYQCLCVLSTWLVVCLVPCAPMSIVCPLPSCYLIIVSVAPAVSPSLPSFVSLYSLLVSAVLFLSVVFRVSMSCELNV